MPETVLVQVDEVERVLFSCHQLLARFNWDASAYEDVVPGADLQEALREVQRQAGVLLALMAE